MLHLFVCCNLFILHLFSCCFMLHLFLVELFSCCTHLELQFFQVALFTCFFHTAPFFRVALFSYCTFFCMALFWYCIASFFMMHRSTFFVLLHIAPCCILLQCCSSFKLHYFHVLFFSYYSVFIMSFFHGPLFMSHHFSCCNVSMLYLMCTLFMLHLRVALFSCRSLDLHFWPVLFYSFHGVPFRCCFSSHWACFTIQSSMSLSFHVVPFFSSTFFIWYFFIIHSPMAILHALVISCCCLLRLQFFILRFFHVALFYLYAFFSCYIFSGCTIFLL